MHPTLSATPSIELPETETLIPLEILAKISLPNKNEFAFIFCEEMTKGIRAVLSLEQSLDKEDKELLGQTLGLAALCYNARRLIMRDFNVLHTPVDYFDIHMMQRRMLHFFRGVDKQTFMNVFPEDEEILQQTSEDQKGVIEHIAGFLAEHYSASPTIFTALAPDELTSSLPQEEKVEVTRQVISCILH
jgi:hypothetical protein